VGTQKPASEPVVAAHERLVKSLPMHDEQDFTDARRGFLGALEPGIVRDAEGRVVWDNDSYAFLVGDASTTVNPSL
jgi:alkyl sulfatase BDS1-like metallo-beta-lactamase superfamily hydrolase